MPDNPLYSPYFKAIFLVYKTPYYLLDELKAEKVSNFDKNYEIII